MANVVLKFLTLIHTHTHIYIYICKLPTNALAEQRISSQKYDAVENNVTMSTTSLNINPCDLNLDGKISIGDLGIAAQYYGKNSNHVDWENAKIADINGDKIVDIEVLVIAG